MRRRHQHNRKNRKNAMQATQARLSMENLEPRKMMTASPVYGPLPVSDLIPTRDTVPAIERTTVTSPHVAETNLSRLANRPCFKVSVAQKGNVININGTACDDFIEVSQPDSSHVNVTVYEDAQRQTVQWSKTYNRSSVDAVNFDGKAGNDQLWNGHLGTQSIFISNIGTVTFPATVEQHDLRVIGKGGPGDDRLEGGNSTDWLYGNDGDDTLHGNNGNDLLFGNNGNDKLVGGNGADRLSGDSGHDSLYGRGGADSLYGGAGYDGLYGGAGKDYLDGGTSSDRYLVYEGGDTYKMSGTDTKVKLKDSGPVKRCDVKWGAGRWSDLDIEAVDEAFRIMHHKTRNAEILGRSTIYRVGLPEDSTTTTLGCARNESKIYIPTTAMQHNDLVSIVIHEVGHTWHPSNSSWKEWKSLGHWSNNKSDYTSSTDAFGTSGYSKGSLLPGWTKGTGNWAYSGSPAFITNYAKVNPYEDFAETFTAAFIADSTDHQMLNSIVDSYDSVAMQGKRDFMEDWIDTICS